MDEKNIGLNNFYGFLSSWRTSIILCKGYSGPFHPFLYFAYLDSKRIS